MDAVVLRSPGCWCAYLRAISGAILPNLSLHSISIHQSTIADCNIPCNNDEMSIDDYSYDWSTRAALLYGER